MDATVDTSAATEAFKGDECADSPHIPVAPAERHPLAQQHESALALDPRQEGYWIGSPHLGLRPFLRRLLVDGLISLRQPMPNDKAE